VATAPTSHNARRGRPRNLAADRQILDAVRTLLAEHGYSALTIEGVAARAGVAKSTVYRRWTTKADLVVDAVVDTLAPLFDASPGASPEDLLRALVDALGRPEARAAFLAVISEAAVDPVVRQRAEQWLIDPSRRLVERCSAAVASTVDPDLLFDVVAGAVIHRVLVRGADGDEAFVRGLLDLVGVPPESPGGSRHKGS
jgi:AcrR family transcriptional regulator